MTSSPDTEGQTLCSVSILILHLTSVRGISFLLFSNLRKFCRLVSNRRPSLTCFFGARSLNLPSKARQFSVELLLGSSECWESTSFAPRLLLGFLARCSECIGAVSCSIEPLTRFTSSTNHLFRIHPLLQLSIPANILLFPGPIGSTASGLERGPSIVQHERLPEAPPRSPERSSSNLEDTRSR